MNFYVFSFCLIFAGITSAQTLNQCNGGPDIWCKDEKIAIECGTLSFCKAQNKFRRNKVTPDPVLVELYYESLCPGCRQFILTQLYPTFEKLGSTGILDIKLYPYGNAEESQKGDKWEFNCQHGATECVLNQVETCALHLLAHPSQFMPYIHCVEQKPSLKKAKKCANNLQIEWGPISKCYNGTEGNYLEHQMAVKTDSLKPEHQYVPWIVVNGKHTDKIQNAAEDDLIDFVCKTYTGVKPHACRVHKSANQRCHKN